MLVVQTVFTVGSPLGISVWESPRSGNKRWVTNDGCPPQNIGSIGCNGKKGTCKQASMMSSRAKNSTGKRKTMIDPIDLIGSIDFCFT